MAGYSLSIVLLIPDAHKQAINALAEAAGYGPDSLSVELRAADSSIWWGGHTMAMPEFLDVLAGAAAENPEPLAALIMSVHDTELGESSELPHWQEALAANNLTQPSEATL